MSEDPQVPPGREGFAEHLSKKTSMPSEVKVRQNIYLALLENPINLPIHLQKRYIN